MLQNKTNKKKLVSKVELANTPFKRFKGLMLKSSYDKALVFNFPQENTLLTTVHNFFVFMSIDLIYLDKNKKVVDIKRNFLPFTPYYAPSKPAKYLVEAQARIIPANAVKVGDTLSW